MSQIEPEGNRNKLAKIKIDFHNPNTAYLLWEDSLKVHYRMKPDIGVPR